MCGREGERETETERGGGDIKFNLKKKKPFFYQLIILKSTVLEKYKVFNNLFQKWGDRFEESFTHDDQTHGGKKYCENGKKKY